MTAPRVPFASVPSLASSASHTTCASSAPAPPRVTDVTACWTHRPSAPSPRLLYWLARIDAGWRPNKRVRREGYHGAAERFGVYIWEYLNVIAPTLYANVGTPVGDATRAWLAQR